MGLTAPRDGDVALAIGVGVALGWGGKDSVSNNIDEWMGVSAGVDSGPWETGTGRRRH